MVDIHLLCRLRTSRSSWGTRRSRWVAWRSEWSLCKRTPPTLTLLLPHWRSLLQKRWVYVCILISNTTLHLWRLRICDRCLCPLVGTHHWASKGAARQRRPGKDRGTWLEQEGTERVKGETEFTAGRPVRQRGEKNGFRNTSSHKYRQTLVYCGSINKGETDWNERQAFSISLFFDESRRPVLNLMYFQSAQALLVW